MTLGYGGCMQVHPCRPVVPVADEWVIWQVRLRYAADQI